MKVFLHPVGLHSHAMVRVTEALQRYAPEEVTIVGRPHQADVQVLHVIGSDIFHARHTPEYVVIQYCLRSAGGSDAEWQDFWDKSRFVWSYYDLRDKINNAPFYFAPLGVDGSLFQTKSMFRNAVLTSGFVSGIGAEPIEDVWYAAEYLRMPIIHIGPPTLEGAKHYPRRRTAHLNVPDLQLVDLYNQALWVAGMRYVEGFELPVIEGLACGARPICFDRPDMRQWYNGHAVFVPETTGLELRESLQHVMASYPKPVCEEERQVLLDNFSWSGIARGFWQQMNI